MFLRNELKNITEYFEWVKWELTPVRPKASSLLVKLMGALQ